MITEIEDFKLKVIADKELLTKEFKHFLNPLEVEVIGVKDLPISNKFIFKFS